MRFSVDCRSCSGAPRAAYSYSLQGPLSLPGGPITDHQASLEFQDVMVVSGDGSRKAWKHQVCAPWPNIQDPAPLQRAKGAMPKTLSRYLIAMQIPSKGKTTWRSRASET